jgi:putative redox protein
MLDRIDRNITLEGPLDADQRKRLIEIADKCPVHRTLEGGARVTTEVLPPPRPSPQAEPEEHFRDMDAACRKADAAG